jgi:hypothetical protein
MTVVLDATMLDRPEWHWTLSGQFTSSSAYKALFLGHHAIDEQMSFLRVVGAARLMLNVRSIAET